MSVEVQHPLLTLPVSQPEPTGAERRRYSRISKPPLVVSGLSWADVEDVSEGGICLRVKNPLGLGERYTLIVTDGLVHFTRELVGEVVWNRSGTAGLQWVNLTRAEILWLRSRFAQWPGKYRVILRRKAVRAHNVLRELRQRLRFAVRGTAATRRFKLRRVNLSGW